MARSLIPWRDKTPTRPDGELDPFTSFRREMDRMFDDFFGGSCLLQNALNESVDGAGMAVIKLLEGAHILLKKPAHERRVGRHFAGAT